MESIVSLEEIINELSAPRQEAFYQIFDVKSYSGGEIFIPDSFHEKAHGYFKKGEETKEQTLSRVRNQKIIRITNKFTGEQALFNSLRAYRPGSRNSSSKDSREKLDRFIEDKRKNCDFCEVEKFTSIDLGKRIKKGTCITAANSAKADDYHGMIVFKEHHPLKLTQQDINDSIDLGREWFERANQQDKDAIYPILIWNCLPKAGASQIHSHMQMLLAKDSAYSKVENLRSASEKYRSENTRDYFEGVFRVHETLGLGFRKESRIMAYLTPAKDSEVIAFDRDINNLKKPVYDVMKCFIDNLGIFSFNLAVQMPPLTEKEGWENFPYFARIVSRGDALKSCADVAGMEMYATPVISSDPFETARALKKYTN